MKIINHEYYVSLEVAKLLEQAGFDWRCKYAYIVTPESDMSTGEEGMLTDYVENVNWVVKAPTLEVAQRWVREVKDIDVYIFSTTNNKRGCVYEWGIKTFGHALWVEGQPYTNQYETYEEAQEAGIKKTLEIILQK